MKDKKVLLKTYEYVPSNAIRCLDDFTKRVKFGEKGEVAMPPTQSLLAFPWLWAIKVTGILVPGK